MKTKERPILNGSPTWLSAANGITPKASGVKGTHLRRNAMQKTFGENFWTKQ